MRRIPRFISSHFSRNVWRLPVGLVGAVGIVVTVRPPPAEALTWTRVEEIPASDVFSLHHDGTTLYAGTANTVYIGTKEGTTWTPTSPVHPSANAIDTIVPAGGALWAGTFGRGVYRSTNNGSSWDSVNTGLTGLGANDVIEIVEKSGKLYAGSAGAGVFVLDLASPTHWSEFNAGLPVFTAGTVGALILHGTTLVAPAGPNGLVYRFPEGATEWQEVPIVPPLVPGLLAMDLVSSGSDLFVGTSNRVFRSSDDAQTWIFVGNGLVHGTDAFVAIDGPILFTGLHFMGNNHRVYRSADRGDSWQQIDEVLGIFLYGLEVAGDKLFAARNDGLWWTPVANTGVSAATWGDLKSRFR